MKDEDAVLQLAPVADPHVEVDVCALAEDELAADDGALADLDLVPDPGAAPDLGIVRHVGGGVDGHVIARCHRSGYEVRSRWGRFVIVGSSLGRLTLRTTFLRVRTSS